MRNIPQFYIWVAIILVFDVIVLFLKVNTPICNETIKELYTQEEFDSLNNYYDEEVFGTFQRFRRNSPTGLLTSTCFSKKRGKICFLFRSIQNLFTIVSFLASFQWTL